MKAWSGFPLLSNRQLRRIPTWCADKVRIIPAGWGIKTEAIVILFSNKSSLLTRSLFLYQSRLFNVVTSSLSNLHIMDSFSTTFSNIFARGDDGNTETRPALPVEEESQSACDSACVIA
ncbi:hypothetical protein BT96DRAFT_278285 [Gymnopus androsaceus JB14]|uniref:Uncharacterized protein n=1 Tax=Gymnopus androsaceus JB14 TaxID=1447944 RepID=A0A6A4H3D5_9AGAR|nr:hypothetical protein BT96DRAFT_278285 [Gymnopus androsaceus JB14]